MDNQTSTENKKIAAPLAVFIDPLDVPYDELSDIELKKYKSLVEVCIKQFSTIRTLELSSLKKDFIMFDGHQFTALDELFSYTEDYFKKMIAEFEILFKHTNFDRDTLSSWEHMLIPINFEDNKSLLREVFNGFF